MGVSRLLGATLALAVVLLALFSTDDANAQAPPSLAFVIYQGDITVGGQPIADGLEIVAKVGDTFLSSTVITNNGRYVGLVVGPSPASVGGTIEFILEGQIIAAQMPILIVIQPYGTVGAQSVAGQVHHHEHAPVVAQQDIVRDHRQKQILVAVVVVIPEDGPGASNFKMEIRRDEEGLVDEAAIPRVVEEADPPWEGSILGNKHILEAIIVVVDEDDIAGFYSWEHLQSHFFGHVRKKYLRPCRSGQQQTGAEEGAAQADGSALAMVHSP